MIGVRLGEEALVPDVFVHHPSVELRAHASGIATDSLLLAAWLGKPAPGWTGPACRRWPTACRAPG